MSGVGWLLYRGIFPICLFLVFIVFGVMGCGKSDQKEVLNIKLECVNLCRKMKEPPFTEKSFEDEKQIQVFEKAIRNAEKLNGVLDYDAYFLMQVSQDDGSQLNYVLNIGKEAEGTGLLVNLANSHQGFTISQGISDELRQMIYNH